MITFKKILLTTDFSKNAEAAIPYALDLARQYKGEIYLTYVCESQHYFAPDVGVFPNISDASWIKSAVEHHIKYLDQCAEILRSQNKDVPIQAKFLEGNPVKELLEYAEKVKVDLVVIATHGRTGLSHMLHGSVAERIIRHSTRPVLSVRPQVV